MGTISAERTDTGSPCPKQIGVKPLTGVFGAEISGIDAAKQFDKHHVQQVQELIAKYKVLVLRNQFSVNPMDLAQFAEHFGVTEVVAHPSLSDAAGVKAVKVVIADGTQMVDSWHTDGATRESTHWLTFLQAVDIPPHGRDTVFADMEAAFESFSPKMQEFLSGLTALHSWGQAKPEAPPVAHPLIVDNPVTGRRALYVNRYYTRSIVGLAPHESQILLEYLYRRVDIPEHQLRVVWQPGTLVIWDNQYTQHAAVNDFRYRRVMHRVMVLVE